MSVSKSPIITVAKSPSKSAAPNTITTTSGTAEENPSAPIQTPKVEQNKIEIKIDASGIGFSIIGGSDTSLVSLFNLYYRILPFHSRMNVLVELTTKM